MTTLLIVLTAFLAGSFPTGVVLTTRVTGKDVRTTGSGNSGAANVARTSGLRLGALVALFDILKGIVPLLLAVWLGLGQGGVALAGLAAVLGHDFSVFLRFRGGKGVATTLGVCLVIAPMATIVGMAVWLTVMAIWRYSSLASLSALAVIPVVAGLTRRPEDYVWLAAVLFVLAAGKHWENILRLVTGTEQKFQRTGPSGGA